MRSLSANQHNSIRLQKRCRIGQFILIQIPCLPLSIHCCPLCACHEPPFLSLSLFYEFVRCDKKKLCVCEREKEKRCKGCKKLYKWLTLCNIESAAKVHTFFRLPVYFISYTLSPILILILQIRAWIWYIYESQALCTFSKICSQINWIFPIIWFVNYQLAV